MRERSRASCPPAKAWTAASGDVSWNEVRLARGVAGSGLGRAAASQSEEASGLLGARWAFDAGARVERQPRPATEARLHWPG